MEKETKPKNGTMQLKDGKMRLYLDGAWQDFGPAYVAKDMRKIAKPVRGRKHGYAPIVKSWATELESQGLRGIQTVQTKLKAYYGTSEKWMAQDCQVWHGWLQQIWQFRNCTGKKDQAPAVEANKNFRENFDKVFTKAA
jgi:hypothetical protein